MGRQFCNVTLFFSCKWNDWAWLMKWMLWNKMSIFVLVFCAYRSATHSSCISERNKILWIEEYKKKWIFAYKLLLFMFRFVLITWRLFRFFFFELWIFLFCFDMRRKSIVFISMCFGCRFEFWVQCVCVCGCRYGTSVFFVSIIYCASEKMCELI